MTSPAASLPFGEAFERTLRLSRYAARIATARPELAGFLEEREARPIAREEMETWLEDPSDELARRLRSLRARVMLTLAHRDLNGLASLDEVFRTMTALAEACVCAALREAQHATALLHGAPPGDGHRMLVVAALGKLGGEELNVSSDIDLVFLHELAAGQTAGARPVDTHEYFSAVGRALIALLSDVTEDGIAFRVDMRLRPFGDSGPLVTSLGALEDYFIAHARPWERYAWLKARVITGRAEGVRALVEPFVYRRYLDYGLLGALRDLHGRIFEAAVQRRKADDIKVGAGGIREIEFAVQLFQMVRGGRDAGLRLTSTRAALAALESRALIAPERARALAQAYEFLRRLEHRLQYYDDQQTQALPRTDEHRAAIAEAMGFADYETLLAALEVHRATVRETFDSLFEGSGRSAGTPAIAAWLNDPQATPDPEGLAEDLANAGIAQPRPVAARLIEFTRSRRFRSMSSSIRGKVEQLLPLAVAAAAETGESAATMTRLLALFEAIDRREAYFSLLLEYPRVLSRAARITSRSAWAARLIARHPILLDELTRTAASFTATDWAAERRDLAEECRKHAADVERLLEELRHFKQRHVLRLTIADLEGELPVMALSDELSALADAILDVTLNQAAASLGIGSVAGFCIVGYGKLGGKELGYGSDLDIIFLYDRARAADVERLGRLAQRINTWLTSFTAAGVLYETDLRLRPDGASGLLVSSIDAFEDYQRTRAWTWEHQALTRARFCAGDGALGERFEALRHEVLALERERAKVNADIVEMRRKMRAEHKAEARELKHIAGGIIDLEFCVQALVLIEGARHPALRENKGNHTLLNRAGELGLIDPALAAEAADAYLAFRSAVHQAALNDEEKVVVEGERLERERTAVQRLWEVVFA